MGDVRFILVYELSPFEKMIECRLGRVPTISTPLGRNPGSFGSNINVRNGA